jgi:hypothetical protein
MLRPPEVLHDLPDRRSLRVPKDEARADVVGHAEEVELPADLAVIALLDLLEDPQVLVELFPRRERDPVDAGEHLLVRIAPPVGARRVHQLEGAQLPGVGHVRPPAQVEEVSGAVERHGFVGDVVEQLFLVRLAGEDLPRFLLRHFLPDERFGLLHDFPHPFLDPDEVLGGERDVDVEIVVEAVFYRRSYGDERLREQLLDRGRHHVGRAVPEDVRPLGIGGRDPLDGPAFRRRAPEVEHLALHLAATATLALPPFSPAREASSHRNPSISQV